LEESPDWHTFYPEENSLSADLSKAYDVLGVKPGVSNRELKAAHRDLAKVWHPDRFGHDPRLQEKAQEKLKEINEAYEQISSGKMPRPASTPPREQYRHVHSRRVISWQAVAVPLLLFAAIFAVTTRALLKTPNQPAQEQAVRTDPSVKLDDARSNTHAQVTVAPRKENREEPAPEVAATDSVATNPTPAVPTVTVTIDPESGLLAKPDCRLRSRMTYPGGSQPTAYCNISHAPPPKDSRIKSLATKILPK
jgi:DnaJ domain